MNEIPYIQLTLADGNKLYLKATNILSIMEEVYYTDDKEKNPGSFITINHASYVVRENPEDVFYLIRKAMNNKEELLKRLKECTEYDTEAGHSAADDALLQYINDDEISKAFKSLERWYA